MTCVVSTVQSLAWSTAILCGSSEPPHPNSPSAPPCTAQHCSIHHPPLPPPSTSQGLRQFTGEPHHGSPRQGTSDGCTTSGSQEIIFYVLSEKLLPLAHVNSRLSVCGTQLLRTSWFCGQVCFSSSTRGQKCSLWLMAGETIAAIAFNSMLAMHTQKKRSLFQDPCHIGRFGTW